MCPQGLLGMAAQVSIPWASVELVALLLRALLRLLNLKRTLLRQEELDTVWVIQIHIAAALLYHPLYSALFSPGN